jgi:hypothetical protein
MPNKRLAFYICILFSLFHSVLSYAQPAEDGVGQVIQITTQLHSFVGQPSWLLIIRDIDHGQNIPYLYDFRSGNNGWVAFTYSNNYLILASNLQFSPYRTNPYRSAKINNFCHLESQGHIIRGEAMYITITGDLSPNTNTFTCHVLKYPNASFNIINE